MNDNINNIYFLKDTLGKFKHELQKYISNPEHKNKQILNP